MTRQTIHVVDPASRTVAVNQVASLDTRELWVVTIEKRNGRRTDAQNRRMWAIIGEIASQFEPVGIHITKEDLQSFFVDKFLTPREVRMPDGRVSLERATTSDLDPGAFADFVTQIEVWASERGVTFDNERANHGISTGSGNAPHRAA